MVNLAALVPHPPIIIPGIGKQTDLAQIEETATALREINEALKKDPPETVVFFTPHGTVFNDAIVVYGEPTLRGDLSQFGLEHSFEMTNDLELGQEITELGLQAGLPLYHLAAEHLEKYPSYRQGMDHGVLVPLTFFEAEWFQKTKIVVIPTSFLSFLQLYTMGSVITTAATTLKRRIAVIASGDLSHCLRPGAPAGHHPSGMDFDRQITRLLQNEVVLDFFDLDPHLIEKAAECGLRSLIMLFGTLNQVAYQTRFHSYQNPFGVGYAVVSFQPNGAKESLLPAIQENLAAKITQRRNQETPLVRYARGTVEAIIHKEPFPEPTELNEFTRQRAGVFVSIKKWGQLRGCMGTIEPSQANVIAEVRKSAISAASQDPRFNPIKAAELAELVYSVDLLGDPAPISNLDELDPQRYGVIVSRGEKQGLLLPRLEGIDTVAEQIAIAKKKAGLSTEDDVQLQRFEVIRYY